MSEGWWARRHKIVAGGLSVRHSAVITVLHLLTQYCPLSSVNANRGHRASKLG